MFSKSIIGFSVLAAISASILLSTAQAANAHTTASPTRSSTTTTTTTVNWNEPFYADPQGPAAGVFATQPTNTVAGTLSRIPQARWFTPDNTVATIRTAVATYVAGAAATHTLPVLVTYAIPGRDCGSFSAGGLPDTTSYQTWIAQVHAGLGATPAVVIVEPDALAQATDCLTPTQQTDRYAMLSYAAQTLSAGGTTMVYLDGGHSHWLTTTELARRLTLAGIQYARGFSLNISNFYTTTDQQTYGEQVSALLGGSHYVVDVSRNGQGPAPAGPLNWCNPTTAGLGQLPTQQTTAPHNDADLWIKNPGQSDGNCATGQPTSGSWYQNSATTMYQQRAGW